MLANVRRSERGVTRSLIGSIFSFSSFSLAVLLAALSLQATLAEDYVRGQDSSAGTRLPPYSR